MDWLLGKTARIVLALLRVLPLEGAARVGRFFGAVVWFVDRRHRRVALANLESILGAELGPEGVRRVARENFRRIGENFVCAARTALMGPGALAGRIEWAGVEGSMPTDGSSAVFASGHFGNFEVFSRFREVEPSWTVATTYRALRQPSVNAVMMELRQVSGVRFFERTTESGPLRDLLGRGNIALGLLADQHAGARGLWLPFLGKECSTTAAPAIYALRYRAPLATAVCYRTGLARWRLEFGPRIPTLEADGTPRALGAIMLDVNRALEVAVRRDPANWFWVHRRWKPASNRQRNARDLAVPGEAAE